MVAEWLVKHDILFTFQEKLYGGTTIAGGAIVDFVLPDRNIIIRIQSYWHETPEAIARDTLQKIRLEADGYTVIDIWEDEILDNIDYVMSEAVEGREIART